MSFSSEVKKELTAIENAPCCSIAQSYGLLLFGRAFSKHEISILTENSDVAAAYAKAVSILSGISPDISVSDAGNFSVTVTDTKTINTIFENLGIAGATVKRRINFANIHADCCFAAFMRGAFLSGGTVTDPSKEYHLEFSCPSKGLCDDLIKIFDETGEQTEDASPIKPKSTLRNGSNIVYLKKSGEIEDTLSFMGATESSMELMGAKMYKDVRNTVNRRVNFDNANIARSANAAAKQYEAICIIRDRIGLDKLSDDLRLTAEARLDGMELSSAEIAAKLPGKLSVSGVNHRFKKLITMADKIKEQQKGKIK